MDERAETVPPGLIGLAEAARRLGVSDRAVRRLAKSGDVPAVKIGAQWRFDPSKLPAPPQARPAD